MYIEATKKEVEDYLNNDVVTILFFSLPTCSRCKFLLGVLMEGVKKLGDLGMDYDKVKILKINCAEELELAAEYTIESVPVIIVCHGGESNRHSGKIDIKNILADVGKFLCE